MKGNVIEIPGSQRSQRGEQSSGNPIAASKAREQAESSIAKMITQFLLEVYIQFISYIPTLHVLQQVKANSAMCSHFNYKPSSFNPFLDDLIVLGD